MRSKNRSFFLLLAVVGLLAAVGPHPAIAADGLDNSVDAFMANRDAAMTLHFPQSWKAEPEGRGGLRLREPDRGVVKNIDRTTEISIWTENRRDHADAISRLRDIASRYDGDVRYLEIGGWPAMQRSFERIIEQKVRGQRPPEEAWALHASTAIAAGSQVIRIEARIPSNDPSAVGLAHRIGRLVQFAHPGDAAAAQGAVDALTAQPRRAPTPVALFAPSPDEAAVSAASAATPGAVPAADVLGDAAGDGATSGLVQNLGNFGELEVAASTDGRDVIVATNSRSYSTSNDSGATFTTGLSISPAYPANGDPSVGYGQSGNFYFGFIGFPDNTGGTGNNINGCTNPIWTSTDNAQTFTHTGHASWCRQASPTCFPDQEHIAVDSWNPSASNQDQIYNAWRNFGSPANNCSAVILSGVRPALTCSVDGGVTFNVDDGSATSPASITSTGGPQGTQRVLLDTDGDFPRITVGQDGFVYVVYMVGDSIDIDKYTSCAAGLTQVSGFPTTVVSGVTAVPCPVPGLDRCNDGNDLRSPTVAVDDQDASHVFVSYARNTATGNENVYVIDSLDGGENWESAVRMNSGFSTRRFMPWVCSTCGEAFTGFYDRRASNVIDNSLTDYYRGRAKRSGGGSLLAGLEKRLTTVSDSQCMPSPGNWPCSPRSANDSEGCTSQPQLAGTCSNSPVSTPPAPPIPPVLCDFSDCGGANADIDFGANPNCQCTSGANVQCNTGGGCPKYGDYNGQACAGGRVFSAWASGSPAASVNGSIDSFFTSENVCAPQIQVPGDVTFDGTCGGGDGEATLNVCNTGKSDLIVDSIVSDDDQFAVTDPAAGWPVVISHDFCFPFEVTFTPDIASTGPQTATLTVNSNDPVYPELDVAAEAPLGAPNIVTSFLPYGDFGDVCLGTSKVEVLTIQNSGGCPLSVGNIAVTTNSLEYSRGAIDTFPINIAPGDSVDVQVRFAPTGDPGGPRAGVLTVYSNDPDNGGQHLVNLTGEAPSASLDLFVADNGAFGNVCVGDYKDLNVTLQNNGGCPLELTGLSLPTNDDLFVLPSGNAADAQLEPNNSLLLPLRFAPTNFTAPTSRNGTLQADGRTLFATTQTLTQSRALTGVAPPPDINVPAASDDEIDVDFGNVCMGVTSDINIPVCNTGLCTLSVTAAYLEALGGGGDCEDFTIVQNPFPDLVSHDFCMDIVVRFTPTTAEGTQSCQLVIESDDPDESPIIIGLEGTTPTTVIDIPNDLDGMLFPPEVVQQVDNCSTLQPFPIGNNGLCPIEILDVGITSGATEYGLDGLPSMPTFLQAGHIFGAGDLDIEFAPNEPIGYFRQGVVSVDYISDAVTGDNTVVNVDLCGDAFYTGARVLVTYNGTPVDSVERIQIQRITANRNRRPRLDTVSVLQNVPLTHLYAPADTACQDIEFHSEYGTPWNPNQLLPGVYQINATIRYNGRRYTKSVGFSLDSCDFNPQVIVSFP